MAIGTSLVDACVRRPKFVIRLMLGVMFAVAVVAVVPTFVSVAMLQPIEVDTDPENMLSQDEAVRIFHNQMKKEMSLHDMVVVGIVNDGHADGVFNPESLTRVHELTEFAKGLQWEEDGKMEGVVAVELLAPSTVDNMEQGGLGVVNFEWLMPRPPATADEARAIADKASRIPFLDGTLLSKDKKALCLFFPLTRKDLSHRVYVALKDKIAEFEGDERYYITGLPVAEDVFGVEMFIQMAISAPAAMAVIFLLMLVFFRKLVLIAAPMIIAMVSVIVTMGALVICGFPVHIMSSMIPIFIMPIAVLDAVHILSEFFDRYQRTRDREKTIETVIDELWRPMLYTSLTTSAGFASLALTPIPPVQVFGIFVAMGIMAAWLLTMTFLPAYIMLISPRTLENFGAAADEFPDPDDTEHAHPAPHGVLPRFLQWVGSMSYRFAKPILGLTLIVLVIAGYGIQQINVNDNPVKWFAADHPIRVADRALNHRFGGSYMSYLALTAGDESYDPDAILADMETAATQRVAALKDELPEASEGFAELTAMARKAAESAASRAELMSALTDRINARREAAENDESGEGDDAFVWDEVGLFVDEQRQKSEVFKDPKVLTYIAKLQGVLTETGVVGKSNSLADIVKTVHRELMLGEQEQFIIPETSKAVAQCLLTFQNSHRSGDLWHFVTPNFRTASIWVQLTSGDNVDMTRVVDAVESFVAENPPPHELEVQWFGLTYINVVWQEKMVWGMLQAFIGSFLVVFIMMTWLFRSALWGLMSMLPLTATILTIYGVVGLIGKAYDMPVAVLSSLSLGLAIDFAIHFLARARRYHQKLGSWQNTIAAIYGEPARAIARNIIVIAVGFTPLLFAPLTPYRTVGALLAAILLLSGMATLIVMPALLRVLEKPLFSRVGRGGSVAGVCGAAGLAGGALVGLSLQQYTSLSFTTLLGVTAGCAVLFIAVFYILQRRRSPDSEESR